MVTTKDFQYLLGLGFSVIPVKFSTDQSGKVQKKPMLNSWKEYQERKATLNEIEEWVSNKPDGVGIVTGKISNIVVVDVDSPDNPVEISSGLVALSGFSGGRHYYFRYEEGLSNTAKINGLPIDFRGEGGFVVAPPSNYGSKKYTWDKFVEPMYLSTLPPEIKVMLQQKPKIVIQTGESPFVQAYSGERNVTAASVAGSIISKMDPRLWELAGWTAFREWNKANNPPLDDKELRTTWESITKTDILHHPKVESEIKIYSPIQAVDKYNEMVSKWGSGVSTGFEEIDKYFKFMPGHIYLLSGPTHQGKTAVAINIACRAVLPGKRVLFATLEQGLSIIPLIKKITGGEMPEGLDFLDSDSLVSVDDLIKTISGLTQKPDLLIIDHLHFLKKDASNGNTVAIDNMIIGLQNMTKKLNIPLLLLAHVKKLEGDKAPTLDDLRDSSQLSQVPSVVIQIYRRKLDQPSGDSYLEDDGMFMVQKNRVTGRSGTITFNLSRENHELSFNSFNKYAKIFAERKI